MDVSSAYHMVTEIESGKVCARLTEMRAIESGSKIEFLSKARGLPGAGQKSRSVELPTGTSYRTSVRLKIANTSRALRRIAHIL